MHCLYHVCIRVHCLFVCLFIFPFSFIVEGSNYCLHDLRLIVWAAPGTLVGVASQPGDDTGSDYRDVIVEYCLSEDSTLSERYN